MEGGDSLSEGGSGVVVWTEREQVESHIILARERRQLCEAEIELARLHSSTTSGSESTTGEAVEHGINMEWCKYAKVFLFVRRSVKVP